MLEKKTKVIVILIIILLMVVLGISSYFIYDKYLKSDSNVSIEKEYKVSDYVRIETYNKPINNGDHSVIGENFEKFFSLYEFKKIFFKNIPVSIVQNFIEEQNYNINSNEDYILDQIYDIYNNDEDNSDQNQTFNEFIAKNGKAKLETNINIGIRNKILYIDVNYFWDIPYSYGDPSSFRTSNSALMIDLVNKKLLTKKDILKIEKIDEKKFIEFVTDEIVKEYGNDKYIENVFYINKLTGDWIDNPNGEGYSEITIDDFREKMEKLNFIDIPGKIFIDENKHLYMYISLDSLYYKFDTVSPHGGEQYTITVLLKK